MCWVAATRQRLAEEDRLRIAMDRFVRSRTAGSGSTGVKKTPVAVATASNAEGAEAGQQQQQAQGKWALAFCEMWWNTPSVLLMA